MKDTIMDLDLEIFRVFLCINLIVIVGGKKMVEYY